MRYAQKVCIVAMALLIFVLNLKIWKISSDNFVKSAIKEEVVATNAAPEVTESPTDPVETVIQETVEETVPETTAVVTEPVETEPVIPSLANDYDIELIARTIWGEAGGCYIVEHKAAVGWVILNYVDTYGETIEEAVTAEGRFHGYRDWGECPQDILDLAADVVHRWEQERAGIENVGRVIPKDYLYFSAYEGHNRFRNAFDGDYDVWDWTLASPY
jgi:hypothetical protein